MVITYLRFARNLQEICNKFLNFSWRPLACGTKIVHFWPVHEGRLAQLARALAWHARGRRFDSDILHTNHYQMTSNACKSMICRRYFFWTMPRHSTIIKMLVSDSVSQ